MKFKFPLQKVLEHRKVIEGLEQKKFQEAMEVLRQETKVLENMLKQVTEAHEKAGQLSKDGGHQAAAFSQIHEFLNGQSVVIQKQKQKLHQAENLVEAQREILRQAVMDYKIIEKMRENQFEEYKLKRLSDEQKENDEQSILRFKPKD